MSLAARYGRKTDILEIVQEILDEQYCISAFTLPDSAIITESDQIQVNKWGLIPSWTKTPEDADKIRRMTLNARAETVFTLPSYRTAIKTQRCLVPSTGFFEFHHEGKNVTQYYIHLKEEEIFSLGGIYESWKNRETGKIIQTFSIITVPANELCTTIHNGGKNPFRMPLIIPKEAEEQWIDSSLCENSIKALINPYNSELMNAYPVSKDFNKKNSHDKSIIEPATSVKQKHSDF
jgi:putative SOS response-associated peptidase YedK